MCPKHAKCVTYGPGMAFSVSLLPPVRDTARQRRTHGPGLPSPQLITFARISSENEEGGKHSRSSLTPSSTIPNPHAALAAKYRCECKQGYTMDHGLYACVPVNTWPDGRPPHILDPSTALHLDDDALFRLEVCTGAAKLVFACFAHQNAVLVVNLGASPRSSLPATCALSSLLHFAEGALADRPPPAPSPTDARCASRRDRARCRLHRQDAAGGSGRAHQLCHHQHGMCSAPLTSTALVLYIFAERKAFKCRHTLP